jgi:lysophospholipase L1-like esterase
MKRSWYPRIKYLLLFATVFVAAMAPGHVEVKTADTWREVFQSSPADYDPLSPEVEKALIEKYKMPPQMLDNMRPKPPVAGTLRFRFAVSAGGSQLRIRVSNEEGRAPLLLSAASVGLAADGLVAKPGSLKPLTFGGKRSIVIPPGAPALSDSISLVLVPGTELVASVYLPEGHQLDPRGGGLVAVADGDQTLRDALEGASPVAGRPLVTGAEVLTSNAPSVIVTVGDSITDGNRAKQGELRSWPEELARRLAARRRGRPYAVVNAGIGGNRVLASGWGQSALARFDRDALRVEGVSHVVILEGTNDIGMSGKFLLGENPLVAADDLITGYRQMIARAHDRRIKVVLGTITPFGGSMTHSTPEKEQVRQAVNQWIRNSGEADALRRPTASE